MPMLNPFHAKRPALHVLLVLWILFATAYFIYGQYQFFVNVVAKNAYEHGQFDEANSMIQDSKSCQPIDISANEESARLISVDCPKP